MPKCKGILQSLRHQGERCSKIVESGREYCRWHDPEDESWRAVYERIYNAKPEELVDIVFELIEDHPEHRLVLPRRGDADYAELGKIDLGPETISRKRKESRIEYPPWWDRFDGVELQGANLDGAHLPGANLQSASLGGANLQNAWLHSADLRKADFGGASLQGANIDHANLQEAYLGGANLQGASLQGANLQDTQVYSANLQRADLRWANLHGINLSESNLQNADLSGARLQGVDLSDTESLLNVHFAGAWLDQTRLKREQLGDAVVEEKEQHYDLARNVYLALKQNFNSLGDFAAADWAYLKERRMEKFEAMQMGRVALSDRRWKKAVTSYSKFVSDTLVEWLCDYGESVWRIIGWMAALLFVVGPLCFSILGGFVWSKELAHGFFTLSSGWDRFWYSYRLYLLYTLGTVTTASLSGLQPVNDAVKLASGLFAIIGVFLTGLLGFVAGKRIRRS